MGHWTPTGIEPMDYDDDDDDDDIIKCMGNQCSSSLKGSIEAGLMKEFFVSLKLDRWKNSWLSSESMVRIL